MNIVITKKNISFQDLCRSVYWEDVRKGLVAHHDQHSKLTYTTERTIDDHKRLFFFIMNTKAVFLEPVTITADPKNPMLIHYAEEHDNDIPLWIRPWEEWAGFAISPQALQTFSATDLIGHMLIHMPSAQTSREEITSFFDSLHNCLTEDWASPHELMETDLYDTFPELPKNKKDGC